MAEQSIQCVNSDQAVNVQLPINLVKSGCECGIVLQFVPHLGQLEEE